ncbi:hypothetical protein [Aquimarina algiphila]|uniref:Uncharacterized protein n=1 Tax=Aquimarina algiphila TaxID=2047982 RepID=A0A554VBG0_9FLAO|nr:hypothetical protein [Aquimarina algiphila]TSE03826.1 hypothetical protein FOF46_28390 [Aquimarina algiphila]
MSNKNKAIEQVILNFEAKKTSSDQAINAIFQITKNKTTAYDLENYWRSFSLEEFVKLLATEAILDWEEINDDRAILLITEILENIGDDSILEKNTTALEKKYSKPKGTVTDWIFQDDINNPKELLQLLKKDNTILL